MIKKLRCKETRIKYLVIVWLSLFTHEAFPQVLSQTIRGTVADADNQVPLAGATVMIAGSDPVIGAVCDADGKFRLSGIPVGRHSLQFSFIGYEPLIVAEVLVLTGKEVVLNVQMKESATSLQQVEIKAFANKDRPVNAMSMISARQLTMEEASRYAGGIDDPSRLASSFAGVAGSLSSNAIVIRGNAPKGLLWRLEGVEIPNPSHFANVTTFGGGGITALSAQMLTNSDFFTGAFPAEYGNALSGVFDMKMRTGNNEKREHTIKAGIIGIDFASEGPFVKGKKSSYLFNYRYSTLALISPLLPENARGIKYQDLSFKINIPAGKAGSFGLWGLLSEDKSGSEPKQDTAVWKYYQDSEEDKNNNKMGALGISHRIILDDKTYLNTTLSVTGNFISWQRKRCDSGFNCYTRDEIAQNDRKYALNLFVNRKFGANHTNRTGFTLNHLSYDVGLQHADSAGQPLISYADEKGGSNLLQLYSQSRIDLNSKLTLNLGFNAQMLTLRNNYSLEPRAGIRYRFTDKQSVSFAYGLHSRLEPIGFYLAQQTGTSGTRQPNKDLELTKAHHLVLAYEITPRDYTRLRIEPFYQKLFDVPVIPGTSFSMANLEMDWFFNDSLVSRGTGANYGIDITLERFLQKGYYYLTTLSLFKSVYTGGDGIQRDARFNKNYVANFLFGKEWKVGKGDNNTFGINWRFSLLGGDRISPVDYPLSRATGDVVYDENRAFENRKPSTWYLDFTASWSRNKPSHTSTWSLQFVNLLFQKEFYGYRYNFRNNTVDPHQEAVVIPNISYRIDF